MHTGISISARNERVTAALEMDRERERESCFAINLIFKKGLSIGIMHKQKLMNPNGMVIRVIKKNNKQWVNIEQFVQSIESSTRSVLCA